MILTFVEDFTSATTLDTVLKAVPESGLWYNRGVHPLVNVNNILGLLPVQTFTFAAYVAGTTYGKFEDSQLRSDIVTSGGFTYESLVALNVGNDPVTSPTKWLKTNIESLRIKSFARLSQDNMIAALNLNRQLVDSQYLYNVGEDTVTLSGDYSGWAIEPKGSDYVKIVINQIALQAITTDPVSMYVVNQGQLIDTLTLNPQNGVLSFEDVGYTISGKGRFLFVIESQDVRSQNPYNDPLKYKGFVVYPVTGDGATAQAADYSEQSTGNGISFNISAYLDSGVYVTNNLINYAKLLQNQFELDFLRMATTNSNVQSNRSERNITGVDLEKIYFETVDLKSDTVARRYNHQLKKAREALSRTFDNFLKEDSSFDVEIGVQ